MNRGWQAESYKLPILLRKSVKMSRKKINQWRPSRTFQMPDVPLKMTIEQQSEEMHWHKTRMEPQLGIEKKSKKKKTETTCCRSAWKSMLFSNHQNWLRHCSGCNQLLFIVSISQQQALIIHLIFIKLLFSNIPWYILSQQDLRLSVGIQPLLVEEEFQRERKKIKMWTYLNIQHPMCKCSIMPLLCDTSDMRHYNKTRHKGHTANHKMRRTTKTV